MVLNVDHFTGEAYDGSSVAVVRRTGDSWSAPRGDHEVGQYGHVDRHPSEDRIVLGDFDIGQFDSTDDPTNLYTVRSDGTELTAITSFGPGEERASQPTWTSDGRILFTYVTGDDNGTRAIALLNADGSGLEVVVVTADEIGYDPSAPSDAPPV